MTESCLLVLKVALARLSVADDQERVARNAEMQAHLADCRSCTRFVTRVKSETPTDGERAARETLSRVREKQAHVPYTPEERAEVERLSLRETEAIKEFIDSGGATNLVAAQSELAQRPLKISRRARKRALDNAEEESHG